MQDLLHANLSAFGERVRRRALGIPYVRRMQVGSTSFDFLIANVEGHRWFSAGSDFTYAEGAATTYFASKAVPGCVVVDVGAHHGFYTLLAASQMHGNGLVVAIEADRANVEILEKNIALNKFTNVRCRWGIVGETNGELRGQPTCSLDCALSDLIPMFIKIDVEGAEHGVLKGAVAVIEHARPSVMCELHPAKGADIAEIVQFFRARNYRLSIFYEREPRVLKELSDNSGFIVGNDILIAEPITTTPP